MWEKEKMLVASIFSFSHNVFKSHLSSFFRVIKTEDCVVKGYSFSDLVILQQTWPSQEIKNSKVKWAVIDTLCWQGLASVIIPGFTINLNCKFAGFLLRRYSKFPVTIQKWITTIYGLAVIPFIIKPIDKSVDIFMEMSLRKYYHIGPVMEKVVHHTRND